MLKGIIKSNNCNVLFCFLFIPICIDSFKQAVDTLVKYIEVSAHVPGCIMPIQVIFLQINFRGFNISEVIEAGSLGDGTAVPGHYDLDLVIYSHGNNRYSHMIYGLTPENDLL